MTIEIPEWGSADGAWNDTDQEMTLVRNGTVQMASIPASVIHRWKADEGSGSTVADSVGAADGTVNGATWVNGKWTGNYALDGDGSSAYIETSTWGTFGSNLTGSWTIVLTARIPSGIGDSTTTLMGEVHGSYPEIFDPFRIRSGGNIQCLLRDNDGNSLDVSTDAAYDDGAKHRIAIRKSGSTAADIDVFVDGNAVATTVNADQAYSNVSDFAHPVPFLARNNAGTLEWFADAEVDEPMVADAALTAQELTDDYDRQPWS